MLRKTLWVKKDEKCRAAEFFRRTFYAMVMLWATDAERHEFPWNFGYADMGVSTDEDS